MSHWDNWYKLARWQRKRRYQLQQQPLCEVCLKEGQIIAANVVDHVVPHKGDAELFWHGKLQSLCPFHHDSHKQSLERLGYDKAIGKDGWPIDSKHPFNQIKA